MPLVRARIVQLFLEWGAGEKRGEGRRCSNCLLTMPAPVAQSLAPCILMTSEKEIVMQRVLCHKLQQQGYQYRNRNKERAAQEETLHNSNTL
ncbi:hypothetical protein GLYMA_02G083450v4 [Glycine max]|nr:hypothetical protein GLYMA_02G083450v4 [Glycine max]KAH1059334.1 hypothetical protein GYH30_003397 [Glycine max]